MCRLFGMHAGHRRVDATFWLVDAPDSLREQSHHNIDGYGIGSFHEDGTPMLDKRPVAAFSDMDYLREARTTRSSVFVAHLRAATNGTDTLANTHPFEQDDRLFAHNGVIGSIDALEDRLGAEGLALVGGDTDSERFFALITLETRAAGGDLGAGIAAATRWISENLELWSLNFVIATADELFALRYPEANDLQILECDPCPVSRELEAASSRGALHVSSKDSADHSAVVVASERMDESAGWRMLEPGELVRVGADLAVETRIVCPYPPARTLDLSPKAAATQAQPG
jgi:predicted glutamine amidotransferase